MLGQGVRKGSGRAKIFGGECVVRAAGLTHFRRSRSRVRVLLYIRPPCPRREIATMGPKDAPCEHPSPTKTSAPAPSAFIFPRPRSHFLRMAFGGAHEDFGLPPNDVRPCRSNVHTSAPSFALLPHRLPRPPQSNRHPAAAVIHNGLSTEKLSTSLPAALCKTFSPSRLRTRIYNISFARRPLPGSVRAAPEKSPRRCATVSRAAVRRVGEGEGKGGRPLAQCRTMPLVCRIIVCKGGSAQGQPRPCPCVLPAAACLRPRPCPQMGEAPCAKAEVHQANPAPARAFSPRQLVYGRAPARRWAKRRVQRRKCTRPTPPLPVRSPRDSLSTAAPSPADGRSAERKGGSAQGQPRPCPCTLPAATCLRPCPRPLMGVAPCVLPAATCLPPRPRRLNGHPASAGGRENDRMAHRRTTTPTHRTQRGNDTCTIRVPRHKGAQSVVHNL